MDIQEVRRQRLAELIRDKFESQADFVTKTGENQGEVSALLRNKSFGEKKARKIETKCGLPPGWMDVPGESIAGANNGKTGKNHIVAVELKAQAPANDEHVTAEQIIELITAFKDANPEDRSWIIESAKTAAQRANRKRGNTTTN